MKKEEIDGLIRERFKNIDKYFHKAVKNFEGHAIREFRSEIRQLKVFLHLVGMEFEDGLSYQITRRMKTIYGYLGIIQNFQVQLKATNDYVKKSSKPVPVFYVKMLENELDYWKKLSKDYIDPAYNFLNDEFEILAMLPHKLTTTSINGFINYTLYEIVEMSARQDEEALDKVRKLMEDIYYNLPFLKPYLFNQQSILFDEVKLSECLSLFGHFRDKCTAVALLLTITTDSLDEQEKQLIKQMENDWLLEKKEMKDQLAVKLEAMHINATNLNQLSLQK